MDTALAFNGVSFGYGDGYALTDISFEIKEGEFIALLGENGAGKSTVCGLCNGLLKPTRGRVTVCGRDTAKHKTSVISREVGFLFQNPDRQLCRNSVRDEIRFGLEYVTADEAERELRVNETLETFSLDGERDPFGMSRGERQRTALASVIARRPKLLVLDEPTTGLDYKECVTAMAAVSRLNEAGTTIFMISHDMEVAADFARRALVLSKGRLIGDGSVRDVMRNADIMKEASLLPAQIPALAMALAGSGAGIFADAFTIGDMVEITERVRGGRRG
jgi:energy-coupling factor transport system ATP-binding protein